MFIFKRFILFFFMIFMAITSISTFAASPQLANYLGTSSNPRLHLELIKNGVPNWDNYSIDYRGKGGIPWSDANPSQNWSVWNIKDEKGLYYGTFTITSDGKGPTLKDYQGGEGGNYLQDIKFFYTGVQQYQLTASKVFRGGVEPAPMPPILTPGPFVDAPLAKPAVYAGTNEKIVLSVSGSKIVDQRGRKIIIKGLVRPSLEWNKQGELLSVQDIQNMRKWGANALRIDLNQNYWFESEKEEDGKTDAKGSYKQIINAMVHYAIQNNMAVILDLHWVENGKQSPMANKDSIRFWREVADAYKDFGTVIFELFNEPASTEGVTIDKNIWLNGDGYYAGYQQMYDAVRKTGANNLVIINGLGWGYDLTFINDNFRVKGENIVYGAHPYNNTDIRRNFVTVLGKYPLIFTEFGVNNPGLFPNGYKAVYEAILKFANESGISYTGFAWWVDKNPSKVNAFPDLIKDWSGTPLNGGVFVKQDMQGPNRGTEL